MGWRKYPLCYQLLSPLHVGYPKTGNLMRTRGYVTGKIMWAALTARLTRDAGKGNNAEAYRDVGEAVTKFFRFSYLYPAVPKNPKKVIETTEDLAVHYPWKDELFDYRFLDSHAGTTINYDLQTAAEGELREVEYIRPRTRKLNRDSDSLPVYLSGCLYIRDDANEMVAEWRSAMKHLQLGGERGYGWGRVRLVYPPEEGTAVEGDAEEPRINVVKDGPVLAHVIADSSSSLSGKISGRVEPLVGWQRDNRQETPTAWHLPQAKICYTPGSIVQSECTFKITDHGIWEMIQS